MMKRLRIELKTIRVPLRAQKCLTPLRPSRQGIINKLLCVLMLTIAASFSLPSFAQTAYVGTYEDLQAAIANASVDNIVVTANIEVPCETSKSISDGVDETGVSTAQLIINRSLTLQSQPGSKYVIKRVAADGANASALKSLIAIRGNGQGNSGTDNLTQNTVEVSLTNIIIDGGVDWGSSSVCDRHIAGNTCSGRSMIDVYLGGTLNLEDGVELRNGFTTKSDNSLLNDASTSQCFGGAVRVDYHNQTGGGTVNVKAGATIHDCSTYGNTTNGYGGALGAYNYARLNLYGGTIYNCSSGHGGAIACTYRGADGYGSSSAGIIRMYGGTIHDCCATNGGAISMDGNVANYLLGGSIEYCSASGKGSAISIPESSTSVNLVAYTSHLLTINNCTGGTSTSSTGTGGYDGIYKNDDATISETPVYQVTFKNNNTNFAVLSVAQGTWLGEAFPAAPVNADFRFVGWYNGETQVTSSTEISGNITVTAKWDFLGSGTADTPYLIPSADAWNFLADKVNAGNNYAEKFFQLTKDISVTTMVGTGSGETPTYSFCGTFDGSGHVLTFNKEASENFVAPFRYINGATIKNLIVDGTNTSSARCNGGMVAVADGVVTITNCVVRTNITDNVGNTQHGTGNSACGGVLALILSTGNVTFNSCIFSGKILGSANSFGGFVGWGNDNPTVAFNNCLFNPTQLKENATDTKTYYRGGDSYITFNNSYYLTAFGAAQGKCARTINAGTDVTISYHGDGTEYNVSGITSYGTGIKYNDVLYAGDGYEVSLNLSHADAPDGHTFGGYTASSGILSGSDNPYTLTMPASDVTVTASWTPITVTLFATGATNEWMTWCGEDVYTVPEGCTAYTLTGISNGAVTLSDALTTIPAYTPVLIHRTAGELTADVTAAWTADGTAPTSGYNSTTGIVTAEIAANSISFYGNAGDETRTHTPYATGPNPENAEEMIPIDDHIPALTKATGLADGWACYILRDGNFIFVDTDRGIAANRCVLAVKTSSLGGNADARVFSIGSETTEISTTDFTDFTDKTDAWYSIDGRKLEGKPTKKGLYIKGKKKVVIK